MKERHIDYKHTLATECLRKLIEETSYEIHLTNNSKNTMDTATPSGTETGTSSGNLYTASDDMQTCTDEHTCTGYSEDDSEEESDSTQRQQAEQIGHLLKQSLSTVSIFSFISATVCSPID